MNYLKPAMRGLLAVLFVLAGAAHGLDPKFYLRIMPSYLPWHLELVYISGVFEILLGFLVLFEKSRNLAGWGLIALLIAVFPANLHMALNPQLFPGFSPIALWIRLPIQFLLIAWAYWASRPDRIDRG